MRELNILSNEKLNYIKECINYYLFIIQTIYIIYILIILSYFNKKIIIYLIILYLFLFIFYSIN